MKRIDLTGQIFGDLIVLERDEELSQKKKKSYWICKCKCGKVKSIEGNSLRTGSVKSCGCRKRNKNNLQGRQFGYLTVIELDEKLTQEKHRTYWRCKCACGAEKSIRSDALLEGKTISCGCFSKKKSCENYIDIANQTFGLLTAIKVVPDEKSGAYWLCQCKCGNMCVVRGANLRNGATQSCGCLNSTIELKIQNILNELNIKYKKQYSFVDLTGKKDKLRFDFAIFKNDELYALIEYQGEQHYKSEEYFGGEEKFLQVKEYDKRKKDYCKKNNIFLIEIPYWEKQKISKNYILDALLWENF